jgi:integrase
MSSRRGHGEGSIHFKADKQLWCATVDLGRTDGKRKRKYLYGKTRKEVAEQLKVALRDQQQGLPVAVERQTVAQYLTRWLEEVARPRLQPSTYVSYEQKVRLYLIPALGRHQLAKLDPQHVQAMMNALLARDLSPRTVQFTRAILRKALGQAVKWNLAARNVAALTEGPSVPRHEMRALAPEEARRFLDAVKGDRLEALYTVAVSLGLRQGEALGLRWGDLDLDGGTLHVRVSLQRLAGQPYRLAEPKTRRSRRSLPLAPNLVAALRAHRARQLAERLAGGPEWKNEWDLVFTTPEGGPLSKHTLIPQFKKHLARAMLPAVRFHDLRHSCASLLVAQGVHPRVVMEMLGHSTIAVTMNTYSHVLPQAQRDAAALLDALLAPAGD